MRQRVGLPWFRLTGLGASFVGREAGAAGTAESDSASELTPRYASLPGEIDISPGSFISSRRCGVILAQRFQSTLKQRWPQPCWAWRAVEVPRYFLTGEQSSDQYGATR